MQIVLKKTGKQKSMPLNPDILIAIRPVIRLFERHSIPYFIGGSVASSKYGRPRSTLDVDLIVDLKLSMVPILVEALKNDYYIDSDMIAEAIQRSSSFNLIHYDTMIKLDLFLLKKHTYDETSMMRKKTDKFEDDPEDEDYAFSSPEDIIINKLKWYEMGDRVSDHQWNDILDVIKIQANSLDKEYLKKWCSTFNLSEQLEKAFDESGIEL